MKRSTTPPVSASHSRIRRLVSSVAAGVLVLTGAVAVTAPAQAAGDVDGTVSGIVFQDFSSSGWHTTGAAAIGVPANRPVEGVTASAYDAQGDLVGTAVSAADGTYDLAVADAFSDDLRIEFSDWPEEYEPAFAAQGDEPPSAIGANNTSVQFVALSGGAVEDVDFGLVVPDQVVQTNAPIATAIQYAGLTTSVSGAESAVVAQPWSLIGSSDAGGWPPAQRQTLATYGEVGSTWGLTFNRTTNAMLVAAVFKRMSDLGPLGVGGIYRVADVLNADGSVSAGASAAPLFDVDGLPVTGATGGGTIDLGADSIPADRGLGAPIQPATDISAFAYAARVGMGGIATTLDGEALFITNLNDRQIYAMTIGEFDDSGSPVPPTEARRVATPLGEDQQLWALTAYGDRLYMGYVDTGSAPGQAAADADMQAYVVSVPIGLARLGANSGDLGTGLADWRLELQFPLGYDKGSNMQLWPGWDFTNGVSAPCPGPGAPGCAENQQPQLQRWNTWADQWRWDGGSVGIPTGWSQSRLPRAPGDEPGHTHSYPQPILSGLAFDIDGYLQIGLADRTQLQSGNYNLGAYTEAAPNQPLTALWETVANGDLLTASPAAVAAPGCGTVTGQFVLECAGQVGERPARTETQMQVATGSNPDGSPIYATNTQALTSANGEGPGGGEYYNDRRYLGSADIHNEIALGSVVTYPGVEEVASTATDPLDGLYRSGIGWWDQSTGAMTRGFDQVRGTGDRGSTNFQKGGGLGSVALLGVAAPVEIGNRVWLDADLNGRQDADEPAIDGAPVQLWTADENDAPQCLIGETTTATINEQPGTYYFRSDDPDLQGVACDGADDVSFTPVGDYVVVFPEGTGDVELAGPNAGHAGFAGLTWDHLVRTTATSPKATDVSDSNADEDTGEAPVSVGGPGENDHTIDAGWYGEAPYEVLKTVNGSGPPDAVYTVDVVAAANFRGEDRLTAGGAPPAPGDPQVADTSFELTPGTPVQTTQALPFGYTLTFEESDPVLPDAAVTFSPANPDDATQGLLVLAPTPAGQVARVTVTNDYGALQVVKELAGDDEAVEQIEDLAFTVDWVSDQPETASGELSGSFTVSGDGTAAPEPALSFPVGATVTLTETAPAPIPPGVVWGGVAWTPAENIEVSDDGATATVTITGGEEAVTATATNTFSSSLGSFAVTKEATGDYPDLADPVYDTVQIPIEYTYTVPGMPPVAGQTATLNRANDFSFASEDFPTGTTVTVTEGEPTGLPPYLEMTFDGWTGDGITAEGQSASFTIAEDVELALTVTNATRQVLGTFQVLKQFPELSPDDPQLADATIEITWTAPDDQTGTIELTQAGDWAGVPTDAAGDPVTFPLGTVITLEETSVSGLPSSLEWGEVAWSPADPENPESGLVTISSETTPATATVANGTDVVVGTFDLVKAITGDFAPGDPELADVAFTVRAEWDAQPEIGLTEAGGADLILNEANDWATALGQTLPAGAVVTLSEISMTGATPNVAWDGEPEWGGPVTPNADGTATIVITDDAEATPEVVVTNGLTEALGTFSVAKNVAGQYTLASPLMATAVFTVTASWAAGPGTDAGSVDLVLDADNQWSTPAGVDLPTGTVVTLSEVAPSGGPDGVQWGTPTWSGEGLSVGDDGTASFTVGADTEPEFTITNPTELAPTGGTWVGWGAAAAMLLLAAGVGLLSTRRRSSALEQA